MPLAYILPALCYIRLDPSPLFSKQKLPAIATASFGTLVSLTGLILLIFNGPSTEHCSHGQPMPYCTAGPSGLSANSTLRSVLLRGNDSGESFSRST
jgi:sodium-coupled neutral amino acid transporter 11